jgi:hypothetical protein
MPTTLRSGPYRFYFYSYDCNEPRHTHVDRENMSQSFGLTLMCPGRKMAGQLFSAEQL